MTTPTTNHHNPLIIGAVIQLEIVQGRDLVAKDRSLLGRRTSSDPYVQVVVVVPEGVNNNKPRLLLLAQTKTIRKSLAPVWNETVTLSLQPEHVGYLKHAPLELRIFDHDDVGKDDFMGVVLVYIFQPNAGTLQWYKVEKGTAAASSSSSKNNLFCHNATGELRVRVASISGRRALDVSPGNLHYLKHHRITVGLAWDVEPDLYDTPVDLDCSCVAVDRRGNVLLDESVYYGNLTNPTLSLVHSGDETTGQTAGDDEQIQIELDRLPEYIIALYFILTCAGPLTKNLSHVRSAQVRFLATHNKSLICRFVPSMMGDNTALFLLRIGREEASQRWVLTPIGEGHPTARDFGTLIPQIKGYTRDLVPNMPPISPNEKVAIMRKGGTIRVLDYVPGGKLPPALTMGLAWDVTNGINIDLDASAVMLDSDLEVYDTVWFKRLVSLDGSIRHSGDEREGDEEGDDEKIVVSLNDVPEEVKYVGFFVNSYSGQALGDISKASCHLFNPITGAEVAKYSLSNTTALNGYTALVMACLSRMKKGGWTLTIISQPAQGRTVKDNVDELQEFLRKHTPEAPPDFAAEPKIELPVMPEAHPIENEEEIVIMSGRELNRYL